LEYLRTPPGDGDPMADAWNLVTCAWYAMHHPALADEAQRMARMIERRINDWEVVGGYMAVLAAKLATACPLATVEQMRLAIEQMELV
jgi:hypothetical protein